MLEHTDYYGVDNDGGGGVQLRHRHLARQLTKEGALKFEIAEGMGHMLRAAEPPWQSHGILSESSGFGSERSPIVSPALDASLEEVVAWVREAVHLPEYADNFRRNDVDGDTMTDVNIDVLKHELGIRSWGHRRKIYLQYTGFRNLKNPVKLPAPAIAPPAAAAPAAAAAGASV